MNLDLDAIDNLAEEGFPPLEEDTKALTRRIREQDAEIERLERQLELERGERREKDIAAACDHLHETIHRLRALCGDAFAYIDGRHEWSEILDRLRAASKGEQ